jgi:hypothetical protein
MRSRIWRFGRAFRSRFGRETEMCPLSGGNETKRSQGYSSTEREQR